MNLDIAQVEIPSQRELFRGRGYAQALAQPAIGLYRSLGFTEIPSYDKKLDQQDLFLGRETGDGNRLISRPPSSVSHQHPTHHMETISFEPAYDDAGVSAVRDLLTEYAQGQGLRPDNSNIYDDIAALPGRYSSPQGRLYLVKLGDENVGCGGLVPLKDGDCEMKRLYVRPAYRGRGIARALSQKLIDDARAIGYHRVTLSTKNEWPPALNLYLSMGFTDIEQVRFSKMNDLRWLGLAL